MGSLTKPVILLVVIYLIVEVRRPKHSGVRTVAVQLDLSLLDADDCGHRDLRDDER